MTGPGTDDRGQTAFDFAVGMGVFLITVGFILTFIPSIFAPFTVGSGSNEIISDRVAATMAEDVLIEDLSGRAVLNESCVLAFFNSTDDGAGCRFDDSNSLEEIVGLDHDNVNVSIRQAGSIQTIEGVTLATGESPPPNGDISASQRMVVIDGTVYELVVKVW